jgi:hypothetical protein
VFSLRYELPIYMLFRRVLCFSVLHSNIWNVAAFLNTSLHSHGATEVNHQDAVQNVHCFGVSSQLETFPLADYHHLDCHMVVDTSAGHTAYTLLP